jgi:hypothetical protein
VGGSMRVCLDLYCMWLLKKPNLGSHRSGVGVTLCALHLTCVVCGLWRNET